MRQVSALGLLSMARSSSFSSGFGSSGASWGTEIVGEAQTRGMAGSTLAGATGVV